jgi:hypothetical protein
MIKINFWRVVRRLVFQYSWSSRAGNNLDWILEARPVIVCFDQYLLGRLISTVGPHTLYLAKKTAYNDDLQYPCCEEVIQGTT